MSRSPDGRSPKLVQAVAKAMPPSARVARQKNPNRRAHFLGHNRGLSGTGGVDLESDVAMKGDVLGSLPAGARLSNRPEPRERARIFTGGSASYGRRLAIGGSTRERMTLQTGDVYREPASYRPTLSPGFEKWTPLRGRGPSRARARQVEAGPR